ncbi:MAG TPA: hypothetical protein VH280_03865 [Verrucomicrobiae bacterium]|jgi:hypothetical protein|nr:hypothetical protein [Verrucomicrobiae bacterium]
MNSNIRINRKQIVGPRFAAAAGFAVAIGTFIVCFTMGFRLPSSASGLNSNAVEDLLQLARVLTLRVIPALALGLIYLSTILWLYSKKSQRAGEPPQNENE